MSGHSKWSTIHRAKEVKDQARGKLFSKLSRDITIAAKTGGGPNPDANFRLKDAIDKARAASMPKDNIDRAISKATESGDLFEVTYEGFGPGGIAIIVNAATDNKNRTVAEIKTLFEKGGGNMGSVGSVAYNFDHRGQIVVQKNSDPETQMLGLIDLGAEDIEDAKDIFNIYVAPEKLREIKVNIESAGHSVKLSELVMKPKTTVAITDETIQEQIVSLLDKLEDHADVQTVFENSEF